MILIGGLLIYLAIRRDMEPTLLLPMGFGAIIVNLPFVNIGAIETLFNAGIATELFPLLLFIGIGAMIDFGPLLSNPKMFLFGAAAQFGIFFTLIMARLIGFDLNDAASIAAIATADGPTSIFMSQYFGSHYQGAIMVAAYSYMALVPVIQPPVMRLLTNRRERMIKMRPPRAVSSTEKILFPIIGFLLTTFIVPDAIPLLGMLFLGNLLKESGVVKRLATTASNQLIDIMTILIGLTVGASTQADVFLTPKTIGIFVLGALSFIVATMGGVLFVKLMNLFLKEGNKINPLIGSAGVSAVPMAARVSQVVGQKENPANFLLMHAMGPNVAGVIGSAVAAGVFLALFQ